MEKIKNIKNYQGKAKRYVISVYYKGTSWYEGWSDEETTDDIEWAKKVAKFIERDKTIENVWIEDKSINEIIYGL